MGDPRRLAERAATVVADNRAGDADACSSMRNASRDSAVDSSPTSEDAKPSSTIEGSPARDAESPLQPEPLTGACKDSRGHGNNSPLLLSGINGIGPKWAAR